MFDTFKSPDVTDAYVLHSNVKLFEVVIKRRNPDPTLVNVFEANL
jgi:hypothetical protein